MIVKTQKSNLKKKKIDKALQVTNHYNLLSQQVNDYAKKVNKIVKEEEDRKKKAELDALNEQLAIEEAKQKEKENKKKKKKKEEDSGYGVQKQLKEKKISK